MEDMKEMTASLFANKDVADPPGKAFVSAPNLRAVGAAPKAVAIADGDPEVMELDDAKADGEWEDLEEEDEAEKSMVLLPR